MPKSANMRRKSRRFRHLPLYRAIHPRKPAASATKAGPVCRDHRSDPGRGWQTAWEAAAHVEADLRASARRTRLRGRSDHREGLRVGAPSASTRGVCPAAARRWTCTNRLWRLVGGDRRGGAEDPLLCHGPTAQRCRLRAGLSGGGILCRSCRGVRFFGGVPLSILYDNTKLAVARILCQRPRRSSSMSMRPASTLLTTRCGWVDAATISSFRTSSAVTSRVWLPRPAKA